jgi:hypothetical protein
MQQRLCFLEDGAQPAVRCPLGRSARFFATKSKDSADM